MGCLVFKNLKIKKNCASHVYLRIASLLFSYLILKLQVCWTVELIGSTLCFSPHLHSVDDFLELFPWRCNGNGHNRYTQSPSFLQGYSRCDWVETSHNEIPFQLLQCRTYSISRIQWEHFSIFFLSHSVQILLLLKLSSARIHQCPFSHSLKHSPKRIHWQVILSQFLQNFSSNFIVFLRAHQVPMKDM